MDTQKKRPMGYADLSIVQLKTFADRGDARAKEELAKRLGMRPPAQSTRASASVEHSAVSPAPKDAGVKAVAPRLSSEPLQDQTPAMQISHRPSDGTNGLDASPFEATVGDASYSCEKNVGSSSVTLLRKDEDTNMNPQMAVALRKAEALLAAASPHIVNKQNPMPHDANRLIDDAPGASGSMSPVLLARLAEIAQNAPDNDERSPRILLCLCLVILGAIVALFGFSVTRGQHGTWYFVACGIAMCVIGFLCIQGAKLATTVCTLVCGILIFWAAYESQSWLEAILRMAPMLLIAGGLLVAKFRKN